MLIGPFGKPGTFWKGNLHTHSTRSDGKLTPSEVAAAYRARGYHFVAITDHFMEPFNYPVVDTTGFRREDFTTLLGAELHAPQLSHGERWHLLAVGLPLDFPAVPDETGPQIARRAAATGAYVAIAHPAWYALSIEDALTIDAAHAVEIYNHTSTYHNDRGESAYMTDQLAMLGRRHHVIAVDDAHFNTRPDSFGGWVRVQATTLEPDALLAALHAGDFYSSQGPEIHEIAITDGRIRVSCSPAHIVFATGPSWLGRFVRGDGVTSAEFELEPFAGGFVRITVIDLNGRKAWSNPIWLDQ